MATRDYQFIVGPETSTLPTVGTPTLDSDTVNLGFANTTYARRASWFESKADATAVKAIASADRVDNQIVFVDSLVSFFKFDSASSQTGDDINVITPTSGTGRWHRHGGQVQAHSGDAAFVTFKGSAAAAGDFYYNTTLNRLRFHNGSAWATITGLDSTDTFSNKTFSDAPVFQAAILLDEIATPATPATGKMKLYAKSDNGLYALDDLGVETAIIGGTSGTTLGMVSNNSSAGNKTVGTGTSCFTPYLAVETGHTYTVSTGAQLVTVETLTINGTGQVVVNGTGIVKVLG